ncbi:MAG TPA: hypothetical protein VM619_14585 [Luteimonas sp.]|nr:hypothetical protein [Luteimonas sp.]
MPLSWQAFVTGPEAAGVGASFLAAIVGQPEDAVRRVRAASGPRGAVRGSRGGVAVFPRLFAQWHGRAPEAADWPAPRASGAAGFEWLPPEDAELAGLIGQMGKAEISEILTRRLRQLTGNTAACRDRNAVQIRANRLGLWITDVVGGIKISDAGAEIGSVEVVRNAIRNESLPTFRQGRLIVIPREAWQRWKAGRMLAPRGFVRLASIREQLGIRSDSKLCEFAKLGYVPTAIQCNPTRPDGRNTRWGCWFIDAKVGRRLVADRHAGRPMPWHGKPLPDNLRHTWKRWRERKHPASCATCAALWGTAGAPTTFEDFCSRYHPLEHGAKRHLTLRWHPGLTVADVARQAKRRRVDVESAIENGMLRATRDGRLLRITRTDATRWIARRCPTGKDGASWISLANAKRWYGFSLKELRAFVASGDLTQRAGAAGDVLVARQQCVELRDRIGFTEAQAAAKLGVGVAALRDLLAGVDWRGAELIPLVTLQAVRKRMQSQAGHTIEEAAAEVGRSPAWVRARIKDGTVRVSRAPWDRRRLYLSAPMVQRLKAARRRKARAPKLSDAWIRLGPAARLAGVSDGTVQNWATAGEVRFRIAGDGYRRYARVSVMSRARRYWQRYATRRVDPPAWIQAQATKRKAR